VSSFDAWLDARDGKSLAAAWSELAPTTIELAPPQATSDIGIQGWYRTGYPAAQLASVWLGRPVESFAWLAPYDSLDHDLERAGAPTPIFKVGRGVEVSFLEHAVNERDCYEEWDLREARVGNRGVQRLFVAWGRSDGTRDGGEGGRGTVVRFFDREKRIGVCVPLYSCKVSLIGDVDIDVREPLDLFDFNPSLRVPAWATYDLDKVRGLIAQLATEVDAHYDQSASWPRFGDSRYENGPHAVYIEERRTGGEGTVDFRVEGLPWGQQLQGGMRFTPEAAYGSFNVRLPADAATRMLARLSAIEGVQRDS
jgi:hypothetical protein